MARCIFVGGRVHSRLDPAYRGDPRAADWRAHPGHVRGGAVGTGLDGCAECLPWRRPMGPSRDPSGCRRSDRDGRDFRCWSTPWRRRYLTVSPSGAATTPEIVVARHRSDCTTDPRWSRLASSGVSLELLTSGHIADASTPGKSTRWSSVLPPGVPVATLTAVLLASLGTKVRAAEADIPYADSARRAKLVIVGGHVVHHRR